MREKFQCLSRELRQSFQNCILHVQSHVLRKKIFWNKNKNSIFLRLLAGSFLKYWNRFLGDAKTKFFVPREKFRINKFFSKNLLFLISFLLWTNVFRSFLTYFSGGFPICILRYESIGFLRKYLKKLYFRY